MAMKNQKADIPKRELWQEYDRLAKIVLSNKTVISYILKTTSEEFNDISLDDIENKYIEGDIIVVDRNEKSKNIQGIMNDKGNIKLDIFFRLKLPGEEIRIVFVNIEAQGNFNPGYPLIKRGIYYSGCMLADQYGKVFEKSHYELVRKVKSIWICPNPPDYLANTYTKYQLTERMITGKYHNEVKNYDLLDVDMINCGGRKNERYTGIFKILDCLLSKDEETKEERLRILREEFNIRIDEEEKGAMEDMCSLGESIYYKGAEEKAVTFIRNLMDSMGFSAKEAMKQLKVPEEEQAVYEELLKKQ